MAGFLLIHGAMHGGWCFDEVAEILRADGHTVAAPDLPGMGGDEETLRRVTLEDWTNFALAELKKLRAAIGNEPLVLAGHSRGGLNITAAAEADPEAMDALVYITALLIPPGESAQSIRKGLPSNQWIAEWQASMPQGAPMMIDPTSAVQLFAQCAPKEVAEAAMKRLVPEPYGPLETEFAITHERWGRVPRTYILCAQDRVLTLEQQQKLVADLPGTRSITLDADHSPFLCMPEELAEALVAAAQPRTK